MCNPVHSSCTTFSLCHCTLFMSHFFRIALISFFGISNVHFSRAALFSGCTFFTLNFFCCTLLVLHFLHVALFLYRTLHYSLFLSLFMFSSWRTSFLFYFFRVSFFSCYTFFVLHFFPCCTIFIFCYLHAALFHVTLFMYTLNMLLFPRVALFLYCSFFVLHYFHPTFSCAALFSCCTVMREISPEHVFCSSVI